MTADAPAPAELVDLGRYPISEPGSARARELVAACRAQLDATGACELPGFLRPEAIRRMATESEGVAHEAHWSQGKSTPYLEIPDPDWPDDHPRRMFDDFSVGAVAYDRIPRGAALRALYEWDVLKDFVAAALGHPTLYRYDDPLGALNVAVMGDGDRLEWHFDQSDFVVSLALQDADAGGDFLYAPKIRGPEDERYDDVREVLRGRSDRVREIPMNPGTLLLFEGRWSIHCVSPCRGATPRLVALMAYDVKPGTCATPLLQKARYGRIVRPAGEGSAG